MSKKVLIVDDDYAFSSFARRLLEDGGFAVVVAATGQAALEAVKTDRPDFILLDLGLPDIDGFDVLKALRADPQTSAIPVAICSMSRDAADLKEGLSMGACEILSKPLDPRIALRRIEALLSEREA